MKLIVLIVAFAVATLWCVDKDAEVTAFCGPHTTAPPMEYALDAWDKAGDLINGLDQVTDSETVRAVAKIFDAWIMWRDLFKAKARGLDEPLQVQQWRSRIADAKAAALDGCNVNCNDGTRNRQGDPGVEPKGPPIDSISTTGLSGERLGWAVARAYWPASEQRMAVEVQRRESGFNPGITGPTVRGGTMRGLFQINDGAHNLSGKNWRDPMTNGALAYQIWLDAGKSWSPWSTARSARAAAASLGPAPKAQDALPRVNGGFGDQGSNDQGCQVPNVRVGTWNIWNENDEHHVRDGLASLATRVDIIGGQEFNHAADYDAAQEALHGWTVVCKGGGGEVSAHDWGKKCGDVRQPIFVSPGLHIQSSGWELGAAAMPMMSTRRIEWVTFTDLNHRTGSLVNTHMPQAVEDHGQMIPGSPRVAVWKQQAAKFVARMEQLQTLGPVVGTGDFNAVPTNNVLQDLFSGWVPNTGDTHDGRAIDYVWAKAPAERTTVLGAHGSDHNGVAATFSPANPVGDSATITGPTVSDPGNPRTPEQAITYLETRMPQGIAGYRVWRHCEGYMTRAYGHPGGYPSARAHWNASGERHAGMSVPPRGALVFWATSNSAGHVALSLGNGRVLSTDFNGTSYQVGVVAEGPIGAIDKWGPRLGWRPPVFPGTRAA